ncbi:MAG TPA: hypothetical protein DCZ72_15615 [Armatimonadetes bacterium]|nr:hypothetical protein [Armatimonadota bacterium]
MSDRIRTLKSLGIRFESCLLEKDGQVVYGIEAFWGRKSIGWASPSGRAFIKLQSRRIVIDADYYRAQHDLLRDDLDNFSVAQLALQETLIDLLAPPAETADV